MLLRFSLQNSNSIRNQVDEEPLRGCATSKSKFISLFVITHTVFLKYDILDCYAKLPEQKNSASYFG